jgi:hypothetical protein
MLERREEDRRGEERRGERERENIISKTTAQDISTVLQI